MCSKYHTLCPHCNQKIVIEIQGISQIDLTMTKVEKEEITEKKYFHELVGQEYKKLFDKSSKITWKKLVEDYSQPDWCRLYNALDYMEGCWSLIFQDIKNENHCSSCEYYKRSLL